MRENIYSLHELEAKKQSWGGSVKWCLPSSGEGEFKEEKESLEKVKLCVPTTAPSSERMSLRQSLKREEVKLSV